MKILWLTWKDMRHPFAGGAEVVNEELAKRLVADGHEVHFVVGGFVGGLPEESRDGFRITRVGNRVSVYWHAYRCYKKHLSEWPDLVIDEMNTIPFFAKFYVKQKNIMVVHQLCREIWFYQMRFPLSLIGYLLEPIYLWLLNDREVITVSESTKKDLMRYGFKSEKIRIISEGIEIAPVADISSVEKYEVPTILSFGAVRSMKRTLDIIRAFELLKQTMPTARLIVAGDTTGGYGDRVLRVVASSPHCKDIQVIGRVSQEKKIELMQKAHVLAVTSVKEGWGLVVTEANSQGTPAAVYDVDGLRDSVRDGETGCIATQNSPQNLADEIINILQDQIRLKSFSKNAMEWSKTITFEKSYEQFNNIVAYV